MSTIMNQSAFSLYYVGNVKKDEAWLLAAVLRGTEHVAFDRTINKMTGQFEFFVPLATREVFLQVMDYLSRQGVLLSLEQRQNRLIHEPF